MRMVMQLCSHEASGGEELVARGAQREVLARADVVERREVLVERVEVRGGRLDLEDEAPHLRCVHFHGLVEGLERGGLGWGLGAEGPYDAHEGVGLHLGGAFDGVQGIVVDGHDASGVAIEIRSANLAVT